MKSFAQALQHLESRGVRRTRRTVQGPQGPIMQVDGRTLLAFASNDYLGLANHPDLIAAAHAALDRYGLGAGASALISGHSEAVATLEEHLARWLGFERVLHFSSGYMANTGILPALLGRGAQVFADALNHACLIDGVRLARAHAVHTYPHCDLMALEQALLDSPGNNRWIVTDAVFSMDGDLAPLPQLVALAETHDAMLLVDDAHGFGVLGEEGKGSLAHWQLSSPRLVYMATLGKAAGVYGAFVGARADLIDWLIQKARTYLFTTGTPPALAAACLASVQCIARDQFRRDQLQRLGVQLQRGAADLPWTLGPSSTAIHPLMLGDNRSVIQLTEALVRQGIWVPGIRPPTVPKGTGRLRISLSAQHDASHVEQLLEALHRIARSHGSFHPEPPPS